MTVINEEKKDRELKESIRMMNSQRNNVEKINLAEEDKKKALRKLFSVMKLLIIV